MLAEKIKLEIFQPAPYPILFLTGLEIKQYQHRVFKNGVGIGSEECKERPCVILQYNSANRTSPNTLVVPITHTTSTLPIVVPITEKRDSSGKLILDGNVLLGNIICVSKARLGDFLQHKILLQFFFGRVPKNLL